MKFLHTIERDCLIINFIEPIDDLSFIKDLYTSECKHLILDVLKLNDLNSNHYTKFFKFGKNLVGTQSFVVVSENSSLEENNIVPTLIEAFDIIEMEDIERQLNL
jgi:hypothetical protein